MNNYKINKTVSVIGGGVSGLFCSFLLVQNNIKVNLYDRMEKPGRKLILAGMSGLNITKNEEIELFSSRYGKDQELFRKLLTEFSPDNLISWFSSLGIETFTGTSGRVFPVSMKGDEVLEKILEFLDSSPLFTFYPEHTLSEITDDNSLVFRTPEGLKTAKCETAVFALGGGSWPNTGSDGKWISIFEKKGIGISPLKPANCGFKTEWSSLFREKEFPVPLKNIRLITETSSSRGEILLTDWGIEGGGVYEVSREIRGEIEIKGKCILVIDLFPDMTPDQIRKKLEKPRGRNSYSNYLRKNLSVNKIKFSLIKELLSADQFQNMHNNPEILKNLKLEIISPRPLEEAVSSAGGVEMIMLDEHMMLKDLPGFYVIGEMADWESPTGGYLFQGCFSTAAAAAGDIINRYTAEGAALRVF